MNAKNSNGRGTMSYHQAKRRVEQHNEKMRHALLRLMPERTAEAIEELTGYGYSPSRSWGLEWRCLSALVQDLSDDALAPWNRSDLEKHQDEVRELVAKYARHPALQPVRDGRLHKLDTDHVRSYNALHEYLVAIERECEARKKQVQASGKGGAP